MTTRAPIVIFIYNRARHLSSTIASLKRCAGFAESRIVIYGDGPKQTADEAPVAQARRAAVELLGEAAEYHFLDKNAGLAASIIKGVSEVTGRFGRAIVLEDDLNLAPNFLSYMNAALDRYESAAGVYQVSGQIFDTPAFHERNSALFLPFTTSWGWGTWRRAWGHFDPLAAGWERLEKDRNLRKSFNLGGSYDFSTMLERQMSGLGDSWAIRWYWSVFRQGGLTCFPPVSLVQNTGLDGSGTHGRGLLRRFRTRATSRSVDVIELPDRVEVNEEDFRSMKRSMRRHNGGYLGATIDIVRRQLFRLTGKHM